jgi:hypothetical protein
VGKFTLAKVGKFQPALTGVGALAEPAHEAGQGDAWDAVGEQEVDVFLAGDLAQGACEIHGFVTGVEYK